METLSAEPDLLARLALARARAARSRGEHEGAEDAYQEGLSHRPGPRLEGQLRFELGTLSIDRQRHKEAVEHLRAALLAFEEARDPDRVLRAEIHLAMALSEAGRLDEGRARARRSLEATIAARDLRGEGITRAHLALIALEEGDLDEAEEQREAALRCHRAVGDRRFEGYAHLLAAMLAQGEAEPLRMEVEAEQAVLAFREVGDRRFLAFALARRGLSRALRQETEAAEADLEAALQLLPGEDLRWLRQGIELLRGFVDLARGRPDLARERLAGARAQAPTSFVRMAWRDLEAALRSHRS